MERTMQITKTAGNMPKRTKKQTGIYFTTDNPFRLKPFKIWADAVRLNKHRILEPFAGANNIIKMLKAEKLCGRFRSYDIIPRDRSVKKKDTMNEFPTGYKSCVTNPPWLTNYSASRRGLYYPDIAFANLYQHCLKLALDNCENVAFIIPGTFLRTKMFRERLDTIIFINDKLFTDTENPACIALFTESGEDTKVYYDDRFIGSLSRLEKINMPALTKTGRRDLGIRFNAPDGRLGLVCIDNTTRPSIRFCRGDEIDRVVKHSDRLITRIDGRFDDVDKTVEKLNHALSLYRAKTNDVFLAPFKGLRKDGQYRRRLDYDTARRMIENCLALG